MPRPKLSTGERLTVAGEVLTRLAGDMERLDEADQLDLVLDLVAQYGGQSPEGPSGLPSQIEAAIGQRLRGPEPLNMGQRVLQALAGSSLAQRDPSLDAILSVIMAVTNTPGTQAAGSGSSRGGGFTPEDAANALWLLTQSRAHPGHAAAEAQRFRAEATKAEAAAENARRFGQMIFGGQAASVPGAAPPGVAGAGPAAPAPSVGGPVGTGLQGLPFGLRGNVPGVGTVEHPEAGLGPEMIRARQLLGPQASLAMVTELATALEAEEAGRTAEARKLGEFRAAPEEPVSAEVLSKFGLPADIGGGDIPRRKHVAASGAIPLTGEQRRRHGDLTRALATVKFMHSGFVGTKNDPLGLLGPRPPEEAGVTESLILRIKQGVANWSKWMAGDPRIVQFKVAVGQTLPLARFVGARGDLNVQELAKIEGPAPTLFSFREEAEEWFRSMDTIINKYIDIIEASYGPIRKDKDGEWVFANEMTREGLSDPVTSGELVGEGVPVAP